MSPWAREWTWPREGGVPRVMKLGSGSLPGTSPARESVGVLGTSAAMATIAAEIRRLAALDPVPVLISGEPGTGKGQAARLLHQHSPRREAALVEVGCGGSDAEDEATALFGTEPMSSGARRHPQRGWLEEAQGGTLLLDGVERLTSEGQHRIRSFLRTGRLHRIGGTEDVRLDVRVVATTGRDGEQALLEGSLDGDLYRRLAGATIHLPPIRERSEEDRVALIHRMNREVRDEMGLPRCDVAPDALDLLVQHPWPGNIRQIRNVLEGIAIAQGPRGILLARDLPSHFRQVVEEGFCETGSESGPSFPEPMEVVERRHIAESLAYFGGNRTRAAKALGIARTTLINKIKAYGLED